MLNEDYTRSVIPHLKTVYFEEPYRAIFNEIVSFVNKFNALPSADALSIELRNNPKVGSDSLALIPEISIQKGEKTVEWLVNHTEKWCQDRAIYLAIMDSINIIEGKHDTLDKNALPTLLAEALSVNFDLRVGHDYVDDSDARYEFYHREEEHLPFDLEKFNTITKGGLVKKSLNVALAGTGVGKSLFMCHVAAGALTQMKNVLYITMEMAEERIAERIDANLMNVPLDQLENLSKDMFDKKMHKLTDKGVGKLIVKEYPTGAASAIHFRALLKELKIKRDFTPDLICIDYLNICSSARMKSMGGAINSYIMVKAIAEELRGLAVEYNVPILTATQTTRSGFASSDVGLEDTAESFGLPATADLMFALISTDELEDLNQIMVKQLKNRYNDPTGANRKFVLGIDRAKMRLYDVEDTAQTLNVRPEPVHKQQQQFDGFNYE
jgi:archaellum biogenesis ATPase FlaH